jgi:hypothetical protein
VRFVVGVCTRVFTAEAPDTSDIAPVIADDAKHHR